MIKAGERQAIDVHPGTHSLQAHIDWSGRPALAFSVLPGDTAWLEVEPAGNALQFWQAFTRTRYLRLTLQRVGTT
ncbi:hypothetical protein J4573_04695 [Actinomadura barringtoniae]|uniref:Uncharacterized protein n=1 Tax=Actinomadura barringtoniae TaxID=1427535 RepID=A0A939T4V9_9ACTN|nr:hypothetical protein [Actinomadura barringtoniae]MBO2446377.1 hypothetical protein [Actinomadura barringtoniae]